MIALNQRIKGTPKVSCITKDRIISRAAVVAINTVKTLFEHGVKIHVLNMELVEDIPTARLSL